MRRDELTARLTLVHERYGADALEACLRDAADQIWAPRMAADLAGPPRERIRNWVEKMAIGHAGAVSVREDAGGWIITLDPCGSCGEQVRTGRYEPPWNFGMVEPGHRIAFGRSDITVYQAHLAVAHTLVPIERTGAPWPAIRCAGRAGRACELLLYRDPASTPPEFYTQVGCRKSTS